MRIHKEGEFSHTYQIKISIPKYARAKTLLVGGGNYASRESLEPTTVEYLLLRLQCSLVKAKLSGKSLAAGRKVQVRSNTAENLRANRVATARGGGRRRESLPPVC